MPLELMERLLFRIFLLLMKMAMWQYLVLN